jgi:hypothetical protein
MPIMNSINTIPIQTEEPMLQDLAEREDLFAF